MRGPIAVIDANVLYDTVLRDLLMQLGVSGLFRARWTARIADEWARSLAANRPDIASQKIALTQALMRRAIPDALVEGYERLIETLLLPDLDDCHVLAAAIASGADAIVTLNLQDFPRQTLDVHGVEACTPDVFVMSLADAAPDAVVAGANACRARPTLSGSDYLRVLRRHGMAATADFLQARS